MARQQWLANTALLEADLQKKNAASTVEMHRLAQMRQIQATQLQQQLLQQAALNQVQRRFSVPASLSSITTFPHVTPPLNDFGSRPVSTNFMAPPESLTGLPESRPDVSKSEQGFDHPMSADVRLSSGMQASELDLCVDDPLGQDSSEGDEREEEE